MARRKKSVEQLEQEKEISVVAEKITKEIIIPIAAKMQKNETPKYLFNVITLSDVKFYKNTNIKDYCGVFKKNKIANVVQEINYTPVKMYKLDTGYYIVADQNIRKC